MRLELAETTRQLAAGVIASAFFLLGYFGMTLALWAAAILALISYAAVLLVISRRPPPARRMVADGVSEADLTAALEALSASARRLGAAAQRAPARERAVFERMADLVARIRAHHAEDPSDLRHTRTFLRHDLPRLVETAESYVALAARADGAEAGRIGELFGRISTMTAALERIEAACLENDFTRLEIEAEVLAGQLGRR